MTTNLASSGAAAIFEVLHGWGVRYIFTCPGTTEAPFLDASLAYPDISIITATHESVAVAMADGYARATGRPTVAYLHTNVGLTNGLAHLSAASIAHSPVIILNGLKQTRIQNRGGFTTTTAIRDFVRQYVKWDWQTLIADAIGEDVNRALKVATTEPQGPTYLGIAQDLLASQNPVPVPSVRRYRVAARTRPDPEEIAVAAQILAQATHPLIVAGDEVTQAHADSEIIALAEYLEAPVLVMDHTTVESCAFPSGHPHYIGYYKSALKAVNDADVIVLAGARTMIEFDLVNTPMVPPNTQLIHLSSDGAEIAKIYPTDVTLVGNAKLGLTDLLAALSQQPSTNKAKRQSYLGEAQEAYLKTLRQAEEEASQMKDTVPVQVPALMYTLARLLQPSTIVIAEAITAAPAFLTHILARSSKHSVYMTASGSLGWGLGAALGIKLAMPNEEIVVVIGDGVFQFGIQALWTAVHFRIPVIYVVINNQSYAAVKAGLYRYNGEAVKQQIFPASDLAGPNIAEIARGFGASGLRIERLADLPAAFQTAREQGKPAVIEVMTDTNDVGPLNR